MAEVKSNEAAEMKQPKYSSSSEEEVDPDADEEEDVRCDWLVCGPECCQILARPSCLLVWLCLSAFTQGMLVNGFVNSVLTTLELRYDLLSVESGLIASSYDIGCVLCLVPVTYFGGRRRRSRLIAIGMLIMGVGSFVFTLPQFTTDRYIYQSPIAPLCYPSGRTYPSFCSPTVLNNYKWVFWLGQFLHGIGATPLYTLGVSYLDDNLSIQQSGAFLGVYYSMSVLGPAMGYLLGGIFLNMYVDLGYEPSDLTSADTNLWVGAWWLGFLVTGVMSLLIVIPIFGFPLSFRGSKKLRRERQKESYGDSEKECSDMTMGIKDLCPSARIILTNPTFVFLSLAGAADAILTAGLSTFGPKMLQTLFYLSASSATLTIGLVSVPCAAVGLMIGGLVIRFSKLSVKQLMWMNVIASVVGVAIAFGFFVRCQTQSFAGVNAHYSVSPHQTNNLTAGCNVNCNCEANRFLFSPLCGADGVNYYSPCFAGCSNNASSVNDANYYSNCACIAQQMQVGGANYSAKAGTCSDANCNLVPVALFLVGMFMFSVFFISIPTLQSTMRVVPPGLKSFSLGIQWIILRCLGSIPAPLLFGRLIDTTCLLRNGGCGSAGSCSFYDGQSFWIVLMIFVFAFKACELLFLFLAAVLYKPPVQSDSTDNNELQPNSSSTSNNNNNDNDNNNNDNYNDNNNDKTANGNKDSTAFENKAFQ